MAQDANPVPPPKPAKKPGSPPASPPAQASSTVWIEAAFQYAEAAKQAGVPLGVTALQQPLYASIPSGYPYTKGGFDDGSATGYVSLVESIVTFAASNAKQTYTPMYTSWPTNAPPVALNSTQAWLPGPVTTNCVIGFGYDWRQDNLATTGKMLQNFLYNLTTAAGNTVDKITLIGHSMGGLVSRSYLESVALSSSTKSPQDATILGMIDQLITLGTPHLGAPMALAPISKTLSLGKGLEGEVLALFLSEILTGTPETFANLFAIIDGVVNSSGGAVQPGAGVSTYQLLPNGSFIDASGKEYPIYPYANLPAGLQALLNSAGLQQPSLNAAAAMFNALSYAKNPTSSITYQCIYGVVDLLHRSPSLKLKLLDRTTTGYTYDGSKLSAVRPVGGGDLVVPKESAMFVGNSSVTAAQQHEVLGADHMTMPANINIQNVVNGLLKFAS
jgi:hypothetical protein